MPDEEKKSYICPCCGQETQNQPVKVDGKIVDDYLASIMTGEPFNHTFPLYGGKLKITVKSASREEGLKLYDFVLMVEPFTSDSSQLRDLIGIVNSYCLVSKIILKAGEEEQIYMPSKAVIEECYKLVETYGKEDLTKEDTKTKFLQDVQSAYTRLSSHTVLSSTPPAIMNRVINDFKKLEATMLEAGFDENFWRGIVLA